MTFHPEPFKASAIEIFDEPSAKATNTNELADELADEHKSRSLLPRLLSVSTATGTCWQGRVR